MKEKLTLTIDRAAAIARAKAFCTSGNGLPFPNRRDAVQPFGNQVVVEKWGGKFKEPPLESIRPRLTYLRKKYLGAKR